MLRYDVVDVFTDRAYAGNPLAVVHGGERLSDAQMQAIAREMNLSETAFPVEPDETQRAAGTDYAVRIFTPEVEVPFAGHPTIGTAWVLRRDGVIRPGTVTQACAAGPVALTVPESGPVELCATPRGLSAPVGTAPVLDAVSLAVSDAIGVVRAAGCGLDFIYVRVRPPAVSRAAPRLELRTVRAADRQEPLGGVCVFAVVAADEQPARVHARVFCPGVGVVEDPATGSAAAGLGVVLVADGLAPADGEWRYTVSQGQEAGRPSTLHCRVEAAGGAATACRVAGDVVGVASGTIAEPG